MIISILCVHVEAENSHFFVDVDPSSDIIFCIVDSYKAENLSCVIQAIFKLQHGNCSSYTFENPNYAYQISSNVSIAHLPRDQIFCFVAKAKSSTSTVIIMGTFGTPTGTNSRVNYACIYLALLATGVIHDKASTVHKTVVTLTIFAVLITVATIVISIVTVYNIILKKKQRRKGAEVV